MQVGSTGSVYQPASNSPATPVAPTSATPTSTAASVETSRSSAGGRRAGGFDFTNLARGDINEAVQALYPEGGSLFSRTFSVLYPGAIFSMGPDGMQMQAQNPAEKIDYVGYLKGQVEQYAQRPGAEDRRHLGNLLDLLARIHGAAETSGPRLDIQA